MDDVTTIPQRADSANRTHDLLITNPIEPPAAVDCERAGSGRAGQKVNVQPTTTPTSLSAPEPPPTQTAGPAIWDLVIADARDRDLIGQRKYGTRLRADNGRDALVDLYQELLDAVVYCRQEIEERTEALEPVALAPPLPEAVARDYLSRCEADTVAGVDVTPPCGRNPLRDALDAVEGRNDALELAKLKLDEAREALEASKAEQDRLRTLLYFALQRQRQGEYRCDHSGIGLPGCVCDPIARDEAEKSPAAQSAGGGR